MRLALCALAALLVAGCVLVPVPVPVPVAVTPVPEAVVEATPVPSAAEPVGAGLLQDQPHVVVGPKGATFYDAPGASPVGGSAPGQIHPITGVDSSGKWWQIEFVDWLVWAHESEVTVQNADNVPVVWP